MAKAGTARSPVNGAARNDCGCSRTRRQRRADYRCRGKPRERGWDGHGFVKFPLLFSSLVPRLPSIVLNARHRLHKKKQEPRTSPWFLLSLFRDRFSDRAARPVPGEAHHRHHPGHRRRGRRRGRRREEAEIRRAVRGSGGRSSPACAGLPHARRCPRRCRPWR